jgi:hypothetical protein
MRSQFGPSGLAESTPRACSAPIVTSHQADAVGWSRVVEIAGEILTVGAIATDRGELEALDPMGEYDATQAIVDRTAHRYTLNPPLHEADGK